MKKAGASSDLVSVYNFEVLYTNNYMIRLSVCKKQNARTALSNTAHSDAVNPVRALSRS